MLGLWRAIRKTLASGRKLTLDQLDEELQDWLWDDIGNALHDLKGHGVLKAEHDDEMNVVWSMSD